MILIQQSPIPLPRSGFTFDLRLKPKGESSSVLAISHYMAEPKRVVDGGGDVAAGDGVTDTVEIEA